MGCREVTNLKTRFFHKILMRDLEVFRLVCVSRLTDFNDICRNEGDRGWPNADQVWPPRIYGPQNLYKNNRFRPEGRHDSRVNVTFGTAEGTEDHSI